MADLLPLGAANTYKKRLHWLLNQLPTACVLCKTRTQGGALCGYCQRDWRYRYEQVRWRCQRCKVAQLGGVAPTSNCCERCHQQPLALQQLAVAFDYMTPLDSLIWRFKTQKQLRLAPVLAQMMLFAIQREGWRLPAQTWVAYIPSRSTALHHRGFNPAAELARYVAKGLGLRLQYGVYGLVDPLEHSAQKHRTQEQRWHYAQQAFKWQSSHWPTTLLVVDDVLTTGSTLHGAALCAQAQGVSQVYGLAVARAPWFFD